MKRKKKTTIKDFYFDQDTLARIKKGILERHGNLTEHSSILLDRDAFVASDEDIRDMHARLRAEFPNMFTLFEIFARQFLFIMVGVEGMPVELIKRYMNLYTDTIMEETNDQLAASASMQDIIDLLRRIKKGDES